MHVLATLAAVIGFALLGAVVGYGLGALCGAAWVTVMNTSSFEGYSAMLVFFGFAPAGALIGALGLPGWYLARRARRAPASERETLPPRRRSF